MESFSLKDFKSPPKKYSPIYSFCWNGPLSKEQTLAHIDRMRSFGIKAFYIIPEPQSFRPTRIPTLMDTAYMTKEYLEQYKFAIDTAREYGMECWLYDEGGWPSGGACGQVMTEYPEYGRRTLSSKRVALKSGVPFKLTDADQFAGFIGDKMLTEGDVFDTDVEIDVYFSERLAWRNVGIPDFPDLTLKEATDVFLKLTHEKYKNCLGDHFGSTMTAVFTDEPAAPPLPFRSGLCEEYEKAYGESILPYLPALLSAEKRDSESIIRVRRWYDLCSKLFCENFLKRCKEWANENGMAFTGHLDRDDIPTGCMHGLSYHVMRGLRSMDVPGIDVIWRQIFPGEPFRLSDPTGRLTELDGAVRGENRFFPRYASSAAAQVGSRVAMTESFGVYGSGTTYEQMRFVLGFQAIRGVTLVNPMLVAYCRHAFLMTGELPAFAENHACGCDLGEFNKYIERLSYVCSVGERVCDTALYYPVNDFWGGVGAEAVGNEFDALGRAMESKGIDFDIADDDVIAASDRIDDGIIRMGLASYRKIVIPPSAFIPDSTRELLDRFVKGGGTVYYSAEPLECKVKYTSETDKIRTMKRFSGKDELICIFNEDVSRQAVTVEIKGDRAYLIDVTEGKVFAANVTDGKVGLTLESGETCAVLVTDKDIECDVRRETESETVLSSFVFRRTNAFTVGEKDLSTVDICEEEKPITLGPWESTVGIEFSGSGVYKTAFDRPDTDAVLDLGDVKYTCEVFVNGVSLGIKVMPPYRYDLPSDVLEDSNVLEIRVSNTPANQYQFTISFEKWGKWQLTPYHDRQLIFDRDVLDSGLYGPVKILH